MDSDRVTLKIPRPLYKRLRQIIEGTGFRSVNAFVIHILRDLLAETRQQEPVSLSEKEVELVRKRLRSLGYLE